MNLFGRGGARMVNLLNLGADGINEMRSEARRLGLVLDNEMVREAENAADQIDRLQRAIGVNFNRALLTVLPLVTRFAAKLAEAGPKIAKAIQFFAPAELVGVEELDRRISQAGSIIEQLRTHIAAPLETAPLELISIEKRVEFLKKMRDQAAAADAAMTDMFEPPPEADKLAQTLDDLRFRLEQLGRTEFEREVAEQLRQTDQQGRSQIETLVRQIQAREAINERVKQYKSLLEEARTPLERLHETTTQILADVREGLISQEDANRIIQHLSEQAEQQMKNLQDLKDDGEDAWATMGEAVEGWGDQFAGEMAQALVTGKLTWKAMARSFIADFVKQALAATVFNPLFRALGASLTGFGGSAGTATALVGGGTGVVHMQHGGRLAGAQASVVGEAGPELFVPSSAGSITPNDALGGGVTINQTLVIQPGLGAEVRHQILGARPMIEEWSKSAVADAVRRGGALSHSIRGGR
jgi:lambda family phage tail tape measure protein